MKKKKYHKPLVCAFDMEQQQLMASSESSNQGIDSNQEGLDGGGIDKDGELDPAAKRWDTRYSLWDEEE